MPTNIRNAIRMIQPFYSDGASVEKAKTFWDTFERATVGLEESICLSAFRECLKGKTGEDWWTYSRINSFDTLRTRFHNQFICQTPLQLIEKLQNTKRPRGMSAEVWGDMISGLCDDAQCYDEQIRYQYFLTGLRNKQWRAALDGSMIDSIRGAVTQLLFKNMHLPSDNDEEFENTSTIRTENAALERMMNMMQQTQNLLVQQQQQQQQLLERPLAAAYPAPAMNVAAAYYPPAPSVPIPQAQPAATTPTTPFRGIRHGPDLYTQDGQIVLLERLLLKRLHQSKDKRPDSSDGGEREGKGVSLLPLVNGTTQSLRKAVQRGVELERTDSLTSLEENTSPERDAKEIVTAAEEPEITPSYARVFSKEELDALQEGKDIGAADEKEEYDKELEDRLFPLDEVELKRRQEENAERSRELSLAELSTLLAVPERNWSGLVSLHPDGCLPLNTSWSGIARRWPRRAGKRANLVATDSDGRDEGGGADPKVFPLKEIKVETVHFPESSGSTPAEEPEVTEEIQKGSQCPGCHAETLRTEKLMEEGSVPIWKQDLETRTRDTLKRFLDPSAVELENLLVRRIMERYRKEEEQQRVKITERRSPCRKCRPKEPDPEKTPLAKRLLVTLLVGRLGKWFVRLRERVADRPAPKRNPGLLEVPDSMEDFSTEDDDLVVPNGKAFPESAFSLGTSTIKRGSKSLAKVDPSATAATQVRYPREPADWIHYVKGAADARPENTETPPPDPDRDPEEELEVDLKSSKLGDEQRELFREVLQPFKDMFVETSMRPGRTDLLEFSIDTGDHAPIKQPPYRVSKAEGDVMESEIQNT
ncbi:hypothetical protein PInf_002664 [Phytophthora infestans]|nr:hypothetical protein PInf_002664 [Phytophthora infestans]